jgi:hypothetical protein
MLMVSPQGLDALLKMTPQASKATNLEANIRLSAIGIILLLEVILMDLPGFVVFGDAVPIFIRPLHQQIETS